jgi:hypothetical protein
MAVLLDERSRSLLEELGVTLEDEASPSGIDVYRPGPAGIADPPGVAADAVNGNIVNNSGSTVIRVHNSDPVQHAVTFATFVLMEGDLPVDDQQENIAAGATVLFSEFDRRLFGARMLITATDPSILLTAFEP